MSDPSVKMAATPPLPRVLASVLPRVLAVNVGQVREVDWNGRKVRTGIWKFPITGESIALRAVNLAGDDQADREAHGGPDKAVYAYAIEDYQYWNEREGIDMHSAMFGENLTIQGVDLRTALVGERWKIGTTELEVAQPRLPCYKLGIRMADAYFPVRFQAAGRLGAYFRVAVEGEVTSGDEIVVTHRPAHGVTLGSMIEALGDRSRGPALLEAGYLPNFWRRVASGESVS